jgi:hypothetical protein
MARLVRAANLEHLWCVFEDGDPAHCTPFRFQS